MNAKHKREVMQDSTVIVRIDEIGYHPDGQPSVMMTIVDSPLNRCRNIGYEVGGTLYVNAIDGGSFSAREFGWCIPELDHRGRIFWKKDPRDTPEKPLPSLAKWEGNPLIAMRLIWRKDRRPMYLGFMLADQLAKTLNELEPMRKKLSAEDKKVYRVKVGTYEFFGKKYSIIKQAAAAGVTADQLRTGVWLDAPEGKAPTPVVEIPVIRDYSLAVAEDDDDGEGDSPGEVFSLPANVIDQLNSVQVAPPVPPAVH